MIYLAIFLFFISAIRADTVKKTTEEIEKPNLSSFHYFHTENTRLLDSNATLKLLFVVHRHGERTLANKFLDEYTMNGTYWPDGDGQLTNPGKLRMYNLGLYLKEHYKNFITSDVREVKVRSSGLDRCIESAEMVAMAMYPPKGRWLWHPNITNFQPVPISSTIPNTDPMINPHAACKAGWKERARIYESDYVKRIERNNANLYEYLTKQIHIDVKNIDDAKAVFDVLMVEKGMHYKLPNWTNPIILSKLENIYHLSFYAEFMTRKAQMFRTGVFINELQEQILNRLQFKPKIQRKIIKFEWDPNDFEHYRAFIYSSHDSFISALLIALGNFDMQSPPFGAAILFEVYQNDVEKLTKGIDNFAKKNRIALDNTFIKFYYLKHTETKKPAQLTLANCEHKDYCSFSEFFKYTEDIILTKEQWYKKCAED